MKIDKLKNQISKNITVVAVSKRKSNKEILEVYNTNHKDFGENRVQELTIKNNDLPKDIRWHMIGKLQRNKVKFIAPFIHLIHSVDSYKLLLEIEKQAKKNHVKKMPDKVKRHKSNEGKAKKRKRTIV